MKELNCCNAQIIEYRGKQFVFDGIHYEMLQINQPEKEIFQYLIENRELPTEVKYRKALFPVVRLIKEGKFFTEKPVQLYRGEVEEGAYIISFPVVHACNLRCRYCFADAGANYTQAVKTFNPESLEKMINYLSVLGDASPTAIRLEFVSGGEVFLKKELFKQSILRIKNIAEEKNIHLQVFVLTNGTLLDREIVDFINEQELFLGISLDGREEIQNFQRPFSDGTGTYAAVKANIEKIMESGAGQNVWLVSVITSATQSLVELLKHHKALGVKNMEMRIARGENDAGLTMTPDNLYYFKQLYEEFAEYLKQNIDDLYIIINRYDTFGKLVMRLLLKQKVQFRCQAGKTKFSFAANGDVYPCDSFVGKEFYKIGNICDTRKNGEIQQLFQNMNVEKLEGCNTCNFRYLCGGDCYFNQLHNGNREIYCQLQKHLCILAIDLVHHVFSRDEKKYGELVRFAKMRD